MATSHWLYHVDMGVLCQKPSVCRPQLHCRFPQVPHWLVVSLSWKGGAPSFLVPVVANGSPQQCMQTLDVPSAAIQCSLHTLAAKHMKAATSNQLGFSAMCTVSRERWQNSNSVFQLPLCLEACLVVRFRKLWHFRTANFRRETVE